MKYFDTFQKLPQMWTNWAQNSIPNIKITQSGHADCKAFVWVPTIEIKVYTAEREIEVQPTWKLKYAVNWNVL